MAETATKKRTDVPTAWDGEPERWWEHVRWCSDCTQHFALPEERDEGFRVVRTDQFSVPYFYLLDGTDKIAVGGRWHAESHEWWTQPVNSPLDRWQETGVPVFDH